VVLGSTRLLVRKAALYTKLKLFSRNPGLLASCEYSALPLVRGSDFRTFVHPINETRFDLTDDNVGGLAMLSDELGHVRLGRSFM
jgi:hypothetical protein